MAFSQFPPAGEVPWASYTPTDTNITIGNGTRIAAFIQVGKIVHFRYQLQLGTTSSITGLAAVGLPIQAANGSIQIVSGYLLDASTRHWPCIGRILSGATVADLVHPSTGLGLVDATNPFTWTSTDIIVISGSYQGV